MQEQGAMRETAVTALKNKARMLIRKGNQLLALATALEDIERSANGDEHNRGQDGRHPYIGVGSDAEEALWELVCSYKW